MATPADQHFKKTQNSYSIKCYLESRNLFFFITFTKTQITLRGYNKVTILHNAGLRNFYYFCHLGKSMDRVLRGLYLEE